MNVLWQRDPAWASRKLGTSNVTIGGYGCTITCIAMMLETTPAVVNEMLLQVDGYANDNLVIWQKLNEAFPDMQFIWRSYSMDWDKVNGVVNEVGGCLVEVDFDNDTRTDGKHWVLMTKEGLADPWTGRMEPISKYTNYTGFSVIQLMETDSMDASQLDELKMILERIYAGITAANKMYYVQNGISFVKPKADDPACGVMKTRRFMPVSIIEMNTIGLDFSMLKAL